MNPPKKAPVVYGYMLFTAEDIAMAAQTPKIAQLCQQATLHWVPGHPMYFPDAWHLDIQLQNGASHTVLWLQEKNIRVLFGFGQRHNTDYPATKEGLKQAMKAIETYQKEMPDNPKRAAAMLLLRQAILLSTTKKKTNVAKKVA